MLDRESQTSAEELAHQQERFDIHVMAFADRSPATAAVLQQAFGLDSAAVERLLAQTPVVVKRGAPPDVAHALLDVLVPLGAQVVLLPAPPSTPPGPAPALESSAVSEPAPAAGAATWGALDLPEPVRARGAPLDGGALSVRPEPGADPVAGAAFASTMPPPGPSLAEEEGDLEFDLAEGGNAAAHALPDVPSEAPEPDLDLGLGDVPPLPELPRLAHDREPPVRSAIAGPRPAPGLPLDSSARHAAPSAQRVPAPPARISLPAPPRVPAGAAGLRPQPAAQTGTPRGQRTLDPGTASPHAPLELALGRERRAASPRAASQEAPRARRVPELEPPAMPASSASLTRPVVPELLASGGERPPAKAEPVAKTASQQRRSRALAVAEILGAAAVLYFGLRLDDTVLHGNASLVSLALHGVAIYALGAGLAGLRP